jgi:hypothetical protein
MATLAATVSGSDVVSSTGRTIQTAVATTSTASDGSTSAAFFDNARKRLSSSSACGARRLRGTRHVQFIHATGYEALVREHIERRRMASRARSDADDTAGAQRSDNHGLALCFFRCDGSPIHRGRL